MEAAYEKVPSSEPSTAIGDEDAFEANQQYLRLLQARRLKIILFANCVLFSVSVILLAATFIRSTPTTGQFVERYSSFSPARSAVRYFADTFNATQGMASGYVGTSSETNEMWDWVTVSIGDQMITPDQMKLINKPSTSVKVKHPKTGEEGYRIGLEVFHQLHCLNLIRKDSYRDQFQDDGDFQGKEEKVIREHLDHCLEMLRMNIMCQADIGVITFHERPDKPGDPYPDFSTIHMCRDFDAIRDWAIENTVANDDVF